MEAMFRLADACVSIWKNVSVSGGNVFVSTLFACALALYLLECSGEREWQESSINHGFEGRIESLKRLPFLMIFYPFGFLDEPGQVSHLKSSECPRALFFDGSECLSLICSRFHPHDFFD